MTRSACKDKENEILEILPIRNRLGLWSPFLVEENIGSCCCAGLFAFTLHSAHSGAVHISCQQLQQLTNWQNIVFWFLYIIAIMLIYSSSKFFYDVLSKSNLLFQLGRPDITDSANFRTIPNREEILISHPTNFVADFSTNLRLWISFEKKIAT